MKFLVIGSGGREHAICKSLSETNKMVKVYCSPGNSGISTIVDTLELNGNDEIISFCLKTKIDAVIIGPELPLAMGLADDLSRHSIHCFGPNKHLAQLESSKSFAKKMMQESNIPTAAFEISNSHDECLEKAVQYLPGKIVLKASGLAGGKGVFICTTSVEVENACHRIFNIMNLNEVLIEQFLEGRECSFFVMLGHQEPTPIGFAVDFKRRDNGDEGPNTGGMGCYTPVDWLPENAEQMVMDKIVNPLLKTIEKDKQLYVGFLYVGIMWSDSGPSVVEFNVRLGDPEAQILLNSLKINWSDLYMYHLGVNPHAPSIGDPTPCVGVVMVSENYPYSETPVEHVQISKEIFSDRTESRVYAGSVKDIDINTLETNNGRVFTVVQNGLSIKEAKDNCYKSVDKIKETYWPNTYFRTDIAAKVCR